MGEYPACATCNLTDCTECFPDFTTCQNCSSPLSLVNLNFALPPNKSNTFLCNQDHAVNLGLYENTTNFTYMQCISQYQKGDFA